MFSSRLKQFSESRIRTNTPPLWKDLVENFDKKAVTYLIFLLEGTDFKKVTFEKNPWAPSEVVEVAEVAEVKGP